jgi:hypothetical protein
MRTTLLDLLLGTPRLRRRIDAELTQLQRDIVTVHTSTHRLRQGIARKATSLPALAIAAASGFVVTKFARSSTLQNSVGKLTGNITWQLLMPLAFTWIRAMLTPADANGTNSNE